MTLISRLVRVDLFSSLTDEELGRVVSIVKRVRYPRGYYLCRQGEPCSSFYILDSGEAIARTTDDYGAMKPVEYLRPGRTLGQSYFLSGKPWTATVEATTDVELLRIDADDFELVLSTFPAMLDRLRVDLGIPPAPLARRFAWQEPGERTIWFSRRHKCFLLIKLASPILSAISLVIGSYLLNKGHFLTPAFLVVFVVFSAVVALWATWEWIHWANDHFIVTSRRVIHTEWGLLGRRERSEASLDKIQDLNVVRSGAAAKALGFGNLIITTASASGGIVFERIPEPEKVRGIIFQQVDRSKAWSKTAHQDEVREHLARRLGLGHDGEPGRALLRPGETATSPPEGGRGILGWILGWRSPFAVRIEEDGNVVWRKHWVALVRELSKSFVLMLLLVLLLLLPISQIPFIGEIPANPYSLVLYGLGAIVLAWMYYQYVDWKNDLYMITPDRIVDMERSPFRLHEARREASLANIQNVKATRPGLLASIFNYGKVVIETAGQTGSFEFIDVADPPGVQRDIFEYMERYGERERGLEGRRRRDEMEDWIDAYHSLR